MAPLKNYISLLLASASYVYAGFNPNSKSNIAIYWGQNSAGTSTSQSRLSTYCSDADTDVILMAFLIEFDGEGGDPVLNFANQGNYCTTFSGTNTLDCPQIAADIPTCQSEGKTIMLSIGGATYSEGGFSSASQATSYAQLIWAMFGPVQSGSSALRPFGSAVVNGFDFDFEANVSNMATFANELRSLMDASGGTYYLSAAPQCPYPDVYDEDLLFNSKLDWVNVQFYNNYCGVQSYVSGSSTQNNFNFAQWDTWARTVSLNPNAKVLLGVPGSATAAGSGYESASALQGVIDYSATFSSFAGVMIWDASQAYANSGFIPGVYSDLTSLKKRAVESIRGTGWFGRGQN